MHISPNQLLRSALWMSLGYTTARAGIAHALLSAQRPGLDPVLATPAIGTGPQSTRPSVIHLRTAVNRKTDRAGGRADALERVRPTPVT